MNFYISRIVPYSKNRLQNSIFLFVSWSLFLWNMLCICFPSKSNFVLIFNIFALICSVALTFLYFIGEMIYHQRFIYPDIMDRLERQIVVDVDNSLTRAEPFIRLFCAVTLICVNIISFIISIWAIYHRDQTVMKSNGPQEINFKLWYFLGVINLLFCMKNHSHTSSLSRAS